MIIRRLDEIIGTERDVKAENGNWVSRRFILKDDKMGFSFHETTVFAGTKTYIWYKHHLEAVYCVGGEGVIEDLETGNTYQISNGTMYALNNHERHYLKAKTNMRLICVFNPPLTGREDHDYEGAYPIEES
ncbi:MAG: ectoine synthase [Nitrospinales bacterium]